MYIMALDKKIAEKFLNRLDSLQKEIESIHRELVFAMGEDKLSLEDVNAVKKIREKNEYKTIEEWEAEEKS